jgi:hypothetical protein
MRPLALAVVTAAAAATGCAAQAKVRPAASLDAPDALPPPRFFPPPLWGEQASGDIDKDAIVRVVAEKSTCSGTLIDEDLVLTAHHCVVERGPRGEFLSSSLAPKEIVIELGGGYLPWGNVGVKAVVVPPCGENGGHGDMAVLVLERKLVGIAPMKVRLDAPPKPGEIVEPAGFGRCALSGDGISRKRRGFSSVATVSPGSFFLSAAICPGDSGGPAVSNGQVVGVISASAMDSDEHTAGASVFARVDTFRQAFNHARLIADGFPKNELPPLACER